MLAYLRKALNGVTRFVIRRGITKARHTKKKTNYASAGTSSYKILSEYHSSYF